jgi:hypothetical protein
MDKIFGTEIEGYFMKTASNKVGEQCAYSGGNSLQFAMEAAQKTGDLSVWHDAMKAYIVETPPCAGVEGVREEDIQDLHTLAVRDPQSSHTRTTWYHVRGFPSLEICPECYSTFVPAMKAESQFVPINRPLQNGMIRVCSFSMKTSEDAASATPEYAGRCGALRVGIYLGWISRRNDFTFFSQLAQKFAADGPPCAGDLRKFKRGSGRKWFAHVPERAGDPADCQLIVCEECYNVNITGTAVAADFYDMTGQVYAVREVQRDGKSCDVDSAELKMWLKEAGKQGDFSYFVRRWRGADVSERVRCTLNSLRFRFVTEMFWSRAYHNQRSLLTLPLVSCTPPNWRRLTV